jgi:hypothetical protein
MPVSLTPRECATSARFAQRLHRRFSPPVHRASVARPRGQRPRSVRRSSGSRGEPSRSDEPDPPQARCSHCGGRFTSARGDAKFCSSPCRQAAYRRRQATSALADVVWRLRANGEIDGAEALILLVCPSARVLERLGVTG